MPYNCQSEDGNLAAVLFTNLETGDVLAACPDCIPIYALALVESATGQSYEPVGEPVASPDADDEDQADEADQVEAPQTPPGVAPAPEGDPGGPADDDQADDDHDQMAEDQDAYGAELAAQVGHRVSG